jgi:hypothetical protein
MLPAFATPMELLLRRTACTEQSEVFNFLLSIEQRGAAYLKLVEGLRFSALNALMNS